MIYKDPIRTIQAELSAGWAYDPFNSTLTDFVFSCWNRPQEVIAIHVRRASVAADQPDDKWIDNIRAEIGDRAALADVPSAHGRAVSAEFKSTRGLAQRVAFVRGPQVELVIEQRSAAPETQDLRDPLERVVRTASSAANMELPADCGPEEFSRSVAAVNLAFEKNDPAAIASALQHSIEVGTSAWLHSMATPNRALEIDAAVRVAQAMMHLGLLTSGPFLVRNADFVLRRAQHSLEAAGIETDWAKELGGQISENLQSIWSELLASSEPESSPEMFPVLSLRERGFRSAQTAAKAFEAGDFENALSLSGMAVNDIMSLIAFLRQNRTQQIPEEIAAHLSEQGITDPEHQKDAIQKAREALLFPPLNMAAQIRHCCALEREDVEAACETVAVRAPLARMILDLNPQDTGATLNLALAMMDCAAIAAIQTDDGKLAEASRCLDEAVRILDAVGDAQGSDDTWIRYHKIQTDAALHRIHRSLAVAEQGKTPLLAQGLSALRSRFQTVATRFPEFR